MKKTKICNTCKKELLKTEFNKDNSRKDKLQGKCRNCKKIYNKENSEKLKKQSREYSIVHKKEIEKYKKEYKSSEKGKAVIKKYEEEHREEKKLYNIAYKKTEKGKKVIKKYIESEKCKNTRRIYKSNYRKKNPLKDKAHRIVANAIRTGKIIKPKQCSICNKTNCRIESHHEDYNFPFDVIWCCKPCHNILDEKRRQKQKKTLDI